MIGIGIVIFVVIAVGWVLSRARPGNEWLAKERAPWVLRRAKLLLCEPKDMIRCTSPIKLHGRPDLVYSSWLNGLIVLETKTRMSEVYYPQDILEMSVYKYILEHGYGYRVSNYGFIRLVVGEYRPTIRYLKVRLLSSAAVEHVAGDYSSIRAGEYTPECVCGNCR